MRKILILFENKLLAQLYKTNLSVYLEAQIIYCDSYKSFTELSNTLNDFVLIISQASFSNVDMRNEFGKLLERETLLRPVIIVGDDHASNEKIIAVKDFFNIPSLLGSAAKILKITAQMMSSYQVPEYYPIDIEFIYYLKKAPTSLYLELNSEYVLFANTGTSIDEVAQDLQGEGVTKFYIKSNERLDVVGKITAILKEGLINSSELTPLLKSEIISNGFDFFINNYVNPQASQEIAHMANICTKVMTEVSLRSPDLQSLFSLFKNNKNNYAYFHTMLGSYVATHIVRSVKWGGEEQVEKVNFAFFFHDIFLAPLFIKYPQFKNETELLNSTDLTSQEKHTVMNHARLAAEVVLGFKDAPMGSEQIVKQHHGMNLGIGHAEEFKDDITPLAKVIIVSEAFVEYFLNFKEQHPTNAVNVVEVIQVLNEKFKKNSYKRITECLLSLRI
jgi:hypothetical protein